MSKWKPPAKPAPKPVVVEEPTPVEETPAAEAPAVEQVETPAIEVAAEEPTNVVTFTAEQVKAPVPLMASVESAKPPTYRHVDGDRNVQTLSREAAIKLLADRKKIDGDAACFLLDCLQVIEVPSNIPGSISGKLERS